MEKKEKGNRVSVYFDDNDFLMVAAMASRAERNKSTAFREIILAAAKGKNYENLTETKNEIMRVAGELGKLGTNLNQIAKHLNETAKAKNMSYSPNIPLNEIQKLLWETKEILREIKNVRESLVEIL